MGSCISTASVWEIVIKQKTGKLTLAAPLGAILSQFPAAGITVLPVLLDHVLGIDRLPDPHKDPFDRLLAAQAIAEGAVLVTADPVFGHYPVPTVW